MKGFCSGNYLELYEFPSGQFVHIFLETDQLVSGLRVGCDLADNLVVLTTDGPVERPAGVGDLPDHDVCQVS